MREQIGSGPKAENNGQKTLPFFSVPSAATYSSGMRPASTKTLSPLPTPRPRSRFAKRFVRPLHLAVGEVADLVRPRDPAQGYVVAPRAGGVPVDGLVGDVEAPAARQTAELRAACSQENDAQASS